MKRFSKAVLCIFTANLLIGCQSFNPKNQISPPTLDLQVVYELPINFECGKNLSKFIDIELKKIFNAVTCLSGDVDEYQYLLSIKHDSFPVSQAKAIVQTQFKLKNNQNEFIEHITYTNREVKRGKETIYLKYHFTLFREWLDKNNIDVNISPVSYKPLDAIAVGKVITENDFFKSFGPAIFNVQTVVDDNWVSDSGTAFLIHPDGLFLTAAHVVKYLFSEDIRAPLLIAKKVLKCEHSYPINF